MPTVFVAGATGYLGRHIVREYRARGWHVRALVRNAKRARDLARAGADLFEAEATHAEALHGAMEGVDLIVSALGLTRQRDGLGPWDVDFAANDNLLTEALRADVKRFAYVHVLNAERMPDVPLAAAKEAFANRLRASRMPATVVMPSGFFSDMGDVLAMARRGRVYLFGDGERRLNPIDAADLARVIADEIAGGRAEVTVGGPDVLTHEEAARAAFAALKRPVRITRLPDWVRRAALRVLPLVTPAHVHGPALFFLTAMGLDMVGHSYGRRRLADHFAAETARSAALPRPLKF